MGPRIGPCRRWLPALAAVLSLASVAQAGDPAAAERFRAAAALQQRTLYDLAADEYGAIERDFAGDPLAERARLERGICLFQLQQYAAAQEELAPLRSRATAFGDVEAEQLLVYLGLAQYNLGRAAAGAARDQWLDAALESLAAELTQFPDGKLTPQAAFYHAESLYARHRLREAVAAYRALVERYPEHPQRAEALYALAVAQAESHDYAGAVASFARFEREYPQHPDHGEARARHGDALYALAHEQFAGGDGESAARSIEWLLAEYPESALVPPALALRARIQLKTSKRAAAEASLDQCLQRSTNLDVSLDARLLRARLRYERENFAGSFADASDVLARDPHRAEALHLRGLSEAGLGRPIDAARTLAQLAEARPNYPARDRVLYDLAWAHEQAHAGDQAQAAYARLIATYPHSPLVPECYFRIGETKYAARDFAGAAECFAAANRTTDPTLREKSTYKLAWCQFELQDWSAAQANFDALLADTPHGPLAADARATSAECCFQRGEFAAALERFTPALDDRQLSDALRPLALVHGSQAAAHVGQWQRSLALADRALQECPAGSSWVDEAHCDRGIALYRLGRLDEADRELSGVAARQRGVVSLQAELTLGRIQVARKELDNAIRVFFKVAYGHGGTAAPEPFRPLQAEAIYAAAGALEATGKQEAAEKLYQELLDNYPTCPHAALARQSLDRILRR
jgi:TolA-binding protein